MTRNEAKHLALLTFSFGGTALVWFVAGHPFIAAAEVAIATYVWFAFVRQA